MVDSPLVVPRRCRVCVGTPFALGKDPGSPLFGPVERLFFSPRFPGKFKRPNGLFSFGREGGKVRMNAYFTSFLFHAEGVPEKGVDFLVLSSWS